MTATAEVRTGATAAPIQPVVAWPVVDIDRRVGSAPKKSAVPPMTGVIAVRWPALHGSHGPDDGSDVRQNVGYPSGDLSRAVSPTVWRRWLRSSTES